MHFCIFRMRHPSLFQTWILPPCRLLSPRVRKQAMPSRRVQRRCVREWRSLPSRRVPTRLLRRVMRLRLRPGLKHLLRRVMSWLLHVVPIRMFAAQVFCRLSWCAEPWRTMIFAARRHCRHARRRGPRRRISRQMRQKSEFFSSLVKMLAKKRNSGQAK